MSQGAFSLGWPSGGFLPGESGGLPDDFWSKWLSRTAQSRVGAGNPGFVEGTSGDTGTFLDWANLLAGDVPIFGDVLGLLSRQKASRDAQRAQDAANRANEMRFGQMMGINDAQQAILGKRLDQAAGHLGGREAAVMGEYDAAQRHLSGADDFLKRAEGDLATQGRTARRGAFDRYRSDTAADAASMQARGLGGSILSNLRAARAGQRENALGDLFERQGALSAGLAGQRAGLAGQMSGLSERRGQQRSALAGDLADFAFRRAGAEAGVLGDRSGIIERRQEAADLGPLFQMLAQSRGGGGGGGSGGFLGSIIGGIGKIFGL